MARFERGVYEPSEDSRVFDAAEDEEADEGSRAPLLLLIALIVVAGFIALVYIAYQEGVKQGRDGAPRIITAERTPERVAPPATDDSPTAEKNLKIYQQPAPADEEADEADSVPAPPTEVGRETTPQPAAQQPPAQAAKAPEKPAEKPVEKPVSKPPLEVASAPPAQTPAALPPAKASGAGAYTLQIGAYKSQAEADTAWKRFEARHPAVGGYEPDVKRVDIEGKGTWYRLRVGAFGTRESASALCAKLKADGGDCIAAKP